MANAKIGLAGSCRIAQRRKRTPKNGDGVSVHGEKGTFVVYGVDRFLQTVEVKLTGHDLALSTIPWKRLIFLDEVSLLSR